MVLDGLDPMALSRTEPTAITLGDDAQRLLPMLRAVLLDGIAIGLAAGEPCAA
jgi:hypothetical protein